MHAAYRGVKLSVSASRMYGGTGFSSANQEAPKGAKALRKASVARLAVLDALLDAVLDARTHAGWL